MSVTGKIAEGRRLDGMASLAPWEHHWNDDADQEAGVDIDNACGLRAAWCEYDGCEYDGGTCFHDAALIAWARNHLAALLDIAEAAQAYRDEWRRGSGRFDLPALRETEARLGDALRRFAEARP